MSLVRNILFLIVLGFPGIAWAQVGCVPNPNLNGPPFVDGCNVPASALNKLASSPNKLVTAFGADPTGVADSTSAFTACLAAAGPMGTCSATNGKYLLGSSFGIPANTTISCGSAFADVSDTNAAAFGTMPALMLSGSATISASGPSATISNCLIYRAGMTFPAANSSAYTGLGIQDAGFSNLSLIDDVIIGYQTCVLITGRRPYIRRVYMDCQGSGTAGTNGAAFELDNGNTDSGFLEDLKIQSLGTGNGTCAAAERGNYGMSLNGIDEANGIIVVQDFATDYIVGTSEFLGDGTLWADNGALLSCSFTSKSFQVNNSLSAHRLDLNGTTTGVTFGTGSTGGVSRIDEIFLTEIGGNCLTMQFGFVNVGSIFTNAGANCGSGYAVEFPLASNNAYLVVEGAELFGVHGGVAPYIHSSSSPPVNIPTFIDIHHLYTDLAAGVNPYSSSILWASGSQLQLARLNMTVSCTGLGSGSCALASGADPLQGTIILSPTGSPSNTGVVTLTFGGAAPVSALNNWACVATNGNGSAGIIAQALGNPYITGVSATQQSITFTQASNLTAGQTYDILYHCAPS